MQSYAQFATYPYPARMGPPFPGFTSFHQPRVPNPRPTDLLWGNNQAAFDFFLKTNIAPEIPKSLKDTSRLGFRKARPPLTIHTDQQNPVSELHIAIGGPANLAWDKIEQTSDLFPFLRRRFCESSNALTVHWTECAVDQCGSRGRNTLKQLFLCLNTPTRIHNTTWPPLSTFRKLSIKVPEMVKDLASFNLLRQNISEDDSIDLKNASNLKEFYWAGDPLLLSMKFKNIPWVLLTVLSLNHCKITVEDAIGVVHLCPNLEILILETIVTSEECELPNIFPSTAIPKVNFRKLESLAITSSAPLNRLIDCMGLEALKDLTLKVDKSGISGVQSLRFSWLAIQKATFYGNFSLNLKTYLQSKCSKIQFREI